MKINIEKKNNISLFTISGRLDAANAEDFKASFLEEHKKTDKFVFDLSELDFLDSTGLGALVFSLRKSLENKGNLKLTNLNKKVRMVFEITKAYQVFDIYDDREAAITSFTNN